MWAIISLVAALIFLATVMIYYRNREKRIIQQLQQMIDSAIDGTYDVSLIDESTLSKLQNSMNRYLADNAVSFKNLSSQKEMIQTLISDISHQTTTPISNILLYTQILAEKDRDNVYGEETAVIKEQTEKLNFLIEALVKLSRLETGIITVSPALHQVQEMLASIENQFQAKAAEKEIAFTLSPTTACAVFDPKWTGEALANIVDNAIKYTSKGGKVDIGVTPYNFFCRIDVADNGIGIKESESGKIFGRFYRSSGVSEEDGLGIGLYLARQIVSLQGGYIKVAAKAEKGSVFSVFLPMQESINSVTFQKRP